MKPAPVVAASFCLMLTITGCGSVTPTALKIDNQSVHPLHKVVGSFAGERKRLEKELPSGRSTLIASSSGREGGLCASFTLNGTRRRFGLAYMTANMPLYCRLRVTDGGVWSSCTGLLGGRVKERRIADASAELEGCR